MRRNNNKEKIRIN